MRKSTFRFHECGDTSLFITSNLFTQKNFFLPSVSYTAVLFLSPAGRQIHLLSAVLNSNISSRHGNHNPGADSLSPISCCFATSRLSATSFFGFVSVDGQYCYINRNRFSNPSISSNQSVSPLVDGIFCQKLINISPYTAQFPFSSLADLCYV